MIHPYLQRMLEGERDANGNYVDPRARNFQENYPGAWNTAVQMYQQQGQGQQGSIGRPESRIPEGTQPTYYHHGKPMYGRVPSRGRGMMKIVGQTFMTAPPKGYVPGAGAKANRGMFLDNMDAVKANNFHNPIGQSVSGQLGSSIRRSPVHRALNSREGRKAQQMFTADLQTQTALAKEQNDNLLMDYLKQFTSAF